MFRHLITSINYPKLIEEQANKAAFGFDKNNSNKKVKSNGKVKTINRQNKKQKHC